MGPAGVVEEADFGSLAVVGIAADDIAVAGQELCAVAAVQEIADVAVVAEAGRLAVVVDTGPAGRAEWPSLE